MSPPGDCLGAQPKNFCGDPFSSARAPQVIGLSRAQVQLDAGPSRAQEDPGSTPGCAIRTAIACSSMPASRDMRPALAALNGMCCMSAGIFLALMRGSGPHRSRRMDNAHRRRLRECVMSRRGSRAVFFGSARRAFAMTRAFDRHPSGADMKPAAALAIDKYPRTRHLTGSRL